MKRIVIIESPYAGDVSTHVNYARAAMRDCLMRGEVPFASHLLYTQPGILDDTKPDERKLGMEAGFELREAIFAGSWEPNHVNTSRTVVYRDYGITPGMKRGIERAEKLGHEIEYRTLIGWGPR